MDTFSGVDSGPAGPTKSFPRKIELLFSLTFY